MNQIFLGQPSDYIKNWFLTTFPTWPTYTTLKFVDGTTQTKDINGTATWKNIGVKNNAYDDDNTLTYCQLGKNVTEISNYIFRYCYSLSSIYIPNSVTSIGSYAFWNCSSLTSITIPSSVISVRERVFEYCYSLTSMTVNPNNPKYDSRDNCNAIIETNSNILKYGCGNSTIPNSVTSIGGSAFSGCISLTSIDIPNSVISIGNYAFSNCSSLISIYIPDSVILIGDNAFQTCSSLTSITIPSSVTSIGDIAFGGCSSLTSIIVDSNNKRYDSRDNCNAIIETNSNILKYGCGNSTIPYSVTSIGERAFQWCYSLTSVSIPSSVTSIGSNAFSDCSSLTSINIPNSVTSIGEGAFSYCYSLTSVSIPSSVISIGQGSFLYNDQLTSVIFEGRTSAEITAMENYPWSITNTSAIKPGIK